MKEVLLKDAVAVVTGAGSGIGAAMARLFAAEGARVIVADLVEERAQAVADQVSEKGGIAKAVTVDVSAEVEIDRMLDGAISSYGRLDILCNNAGIMDGMTPVAETSDELWRRVMSVNLDGPFYACRKVIPVMVAQGGGVILNTASIGGLHGGRAGAAYTASKHALVGLSRNIGYMYAGQGIRCNALCPGAVETAIGLGDAPSQLGLTRMQLGAANMGRIAGPEELAQIALLLVSPSGSFMNGATVVADGGWTAY